MSRFINEVLFEAVKNKLQTAHKSYAKYLSAIDDLDQSLKDLNQLLKEMCDYAVKNNWGIKGLPEQEIYNYLCKGEPEIYDVMEKIVKAFGAPEGEL